MYSIIMAGPRKPTRPELIGERLCLNRKHPTVGHKVGETVTSNIQGLLSTLLGRWKCPLPGNLMNAKPMTELGGPATVRFWAGK